MDIPRNEIADRGRRMLRSAMGPAIAAWIDDPNICEIMLNPDGRVWLDRLQGGLAATPVLMNPADAERVIRLAAHHVGAEVHAGRPRISAELPGGGERFEGLLPPVTAAPVFSLRKPARQVFELGDYVRRGVMCAEDAEVLAGAISERRTLLVAGATSSGKTTLVNSLLAEMARTEDRLVLIEDVRELRCASPNVVALRTSEGGASMAELVRSALRLRPDRIVVGEVRGAEALDLLKAWGTGQPVRLTIELPADVHRTLVAYAEALKAQTGQQLPAEKLVGPMLSRFMDSDRGFSRGRSRS